MSEITPKFRHTPEESERFPKRSRSLASSELKVDDSNTKSPYMDNLKYELGPRNVPTPSLATNGTYSSPAKVLDNKAKSGQSLFGPSNPKISQTDSGDLKITGGDSNSLNPYKTFVNFSTSSEHEALSDSAFVIERSPKSSLTISDDSEAHPNDHAAISTKDKPLTINTGNQDGDTYLILSGPDSITNINGDGKASHNMQRDTIDFHTGLGKPGDTAQLNLKNFNPSKTDLKVDGRSLFGEYDNNYSGTIFFMDNDKGRAKIQMNLQPSNETQHE